MVILVLAAYGAIVLLELVPLYTNKKKKELIVMGILTGFTFALAFLLSLGINPPSPAKPIQLLLSFILGTNNE